MGRVRLALGVFLGLMDLHEGGGTSNKEWLPMMVHADLQSKQYLVDAQTGQIYSMISTDVVSLPKKTVLPTPPQAQSCPLFIPTAPGAERSTEEYDDAPLSEKLDVHSAGTILYGIITGNRPWDNERENHSKAAIQKGKCPQIMDDVIRNTEGAVDAELVRLLDRVYEGDPVH